LGIGTGRDLLTRREASAAQRLTLALFNGATPEEVEGKS
jgi:hypothetical protein